MREYGKPLKGNKVIVAGCRHFDNELYVHWVYRVLSRIQYHTMIGQMVSGHAKGIDSIGEMYADEHKLPLAVFPADWDKHGKAAGAIRNEEMANYADVLVAFWDGNSRGTKHMIQEMLRRQKEVHVFFPDFDE